MQDSLETGDLSPCEAIKKCCSYLIDILSDTSGDSKIEVRLSHTDYIHEYFIYGTRIRETITIVIKKKKKEFNSAVLETSIERTLCRQS